MKQIDLFNQITIDSSFNDIVDSLGIVRLGNAKWCFNGKCIDRPKMNKIKSTLENEFGIFTNLLKYRYDE